jgi:hypothetical protein
MENHTNGSAHLHAFVMPLQSSTFFKVDPYNFNGRCLKHENICLLKIIKFKKQTNCSQQS